MTLASSYLLEREALNSWRLISRQRTLPEGRSELQPKQLWIQTAQLAFVFGFSQKEPSQNVRPLQSLVLQPLVTPTEGSTSLLGDGFYSTALARALLPSPSQTCTVGTAAEKGPCEF